MVKSIPTRTRTTLTETVDNSKTAHNQSCDICQQGKLNRKLNTKSLFVNFNKICLEEYLLPKYTHTAREREREREYNNNDNNIWIYSKTKQF